MSEETSTWHKCPDCSFVHPGTVSGAYRTLRDKKKALRWVLHQVESMRGKHEDHQDNWLDGMQQGYENVIDILEVELGLREVAE